MSLQKDIGIYFYMLSLDSVQVKFLHKFRQANALGYKAVADL